MSYISIVLIEEIEGEICRLFNWEKGFKFLISSDFWLLLFCEVSFVRVLSNTKVLFPVFHNIFLMIEE
jgi:hypothetical protein